MPISRKTYLSVTALLLFLGLAALLGIVAASLVLVGHTQDQVEEILAARKVRSAAADLLTLVQDMETGQRGFLLTGESIYLEPYRDADARLDEQLDELSAALAGSPELAEVVDRLTATLTAKISEMNETIALYQEGQTEEAVAVIQTERGNELMQTLRTDLARLREASEARLGATVTRQERSAQFLRWVSILGAALVVLVVGVAGWLVLRYTRDLSGARQEVEQLNSELEERVRDRTAELGRANDEIQRFAYIVTHDLRAPLVNIMGFTSELESSLETLQTYLRKAPASEPLAQAAAENAGDGAGEGAAGQPASGAEAAGTATLAEDARLAIEEDLPEALGFIRSSTQRMDGLINAILKISRDGRRPLKPETLDLEELLTVSAESIQHQLSESDGQVTLDLTVKSIVSDRLSLEQIVGNLLDNAVKYQKEGRPLELTVSTRAALGHRMVIEVRDNGRGIAPQDHERVFELFRRAGTQDKPGEGIGLAHVRTLVRSLGGDITVESEYGEGTSFFVELPRDLRPILGSRKK